MDDERDVKPNSLQMAELLYHDASRVFYCEWPEGRNGADIEDARYCMRPFYHPYTCAMLENTQRFGVRGLYDVRLTSIGDGLVEEDPKEGKLLQFLLDNRGFLREEYYIDDINIDRNGNRVDEVLVDPDPVEDIDFSVVGAYSQYNWEIFFHIPFLVATRLSTRQRFDQAQRWFHYIFNPTDISDEESPAKYWRVKPLQQMSSGQYLKDQVDRLLQTLSDESSTEGDQELEREVAEWRHNAFNPHLVARTRTTAFQKAVVMHYIDNLVAWGDSLFRRQTRRKSTRPHSFMCSPPSCSDHGHGKFHLHEKGYAQVVQDIDQ